MQSSLLTNTTTLGHREVKWFDLCCDAIKAIQALPQPHFIDNECKAIEQVVMDNSDSATTKEQIQHTAGVLKADILTHRINTPLTV
jgi:hypothetical protein